MDYWLDKLSDAQSTGMVDDIRSGIDTAYFEQKALSHDDYMRLCKIASMAYILNVYREGMHTLAKAL